VVTGEGFLLAPDRTLYSVSPAAGRLLLDGAGVPTVAWSTAAALASAGAIVLEPGGPVRPVLQIPERRLRLAEACPTPVAPSPQSWLSSRIAAQWYAMTVWSLSDDLHGAVQSEQHNRIVPILRKAELFLRMMTIAVRGIRSEVSRNVAMDLQGTVLNEDFHQLLDRVYAGDPAAFREIPEAAIAVFSAVMADCGMPARPDMFEKSRSFLKQLGEVRMWFRVSEGLDIPIQVPHTLTAKGGDSSTQSSAPVFVE
jgi:hypothetical protein